MHYLLLALAIMAETIGTTALKASEQFTRPLPSVLVILGYGLAFYLLSIVLRYMPVGIAYAMWSGLGIVLIALIGWLLFGQALDLAAVIGIGLILSGIVVLQLFSSVSPH